MYDSIRAKHAFSIGVNGDVIMYGRGGNQHDETDNANKDIPSPLHCTLQWVPRACHQLARNLGNCLP